MRHAPGPETAESASHAGQARRTRIARQSVRASQAGMRVCAQVLFEDEAPAAIEALKPACLHVLSGTNTDRCPSR
jgi:hypothetical protein